MKTVRRLFYTDILSSVAFAAAAFLSLFYFIDFVDELGDVGRGGYTVLHAAFFSLLELPGHLYELFPIAVLIGTIYALARMAQSSEYTILRTGGLGPGRALWLLASLGLSFCVLTFIVGDYLAPLSARAGAELRAQVKGGFWLGQAGAWLKERRDPAEGGGSYSVNIGSFDAEGLLQDVRIYEFDVDGRLLNRIAAGSATIAPDATWTLHDVIVTHWAAPAQAEGSAASAPTTVRDEHLARMQWASGLSTDVVAAAVLPIGTMSTVELYRYIGHLSANAQAAQNYQIQFWKRALYPFACLVMVGLALPFAYLHARAGGISLRVFGGIMLGISFVLLNNLAGHLGLLRDWTPWIVAAAPSALYLLLSMAAFSWLVRFR